MNILITGGASGLGKSITHTLAASYADAKIYFTFNSSAEAAADIEKNLSNTVALKLDFKDKQSIDQLAEEMTTLDIDILIHNALTGLRLNHFHKIGTDDYLKNFEENMYAVLKLTRSFIKISRLRKSGKIITILSSAIGGVPQTGYSGYIAEKKYLLSMSDSWASENAQFNIQSNCVSPGFMDTPLNDKIDSKTKEQLIHTHPLKKLLTTNEVADVVKFLVTATPHLNGQNIFLNNGKN